MQFRIFLFCLVFSSNCFSQKEGRRELWVDCKLKVGFLAAHRPILGHLATEHAIAGEVSYYIQGKGERFWHWGYNNPKYGLTAFFGTAGNRELLGFYSGAYAFIDFPLVHKKHYSLSFKSGAGLAYGSKKYDQENNILSNALSSHINSMIVLGLENRVNIGNSAIALTLDMTHFSNGAIKVPNLGLNLPFLSLGYGHRIQKSNHCDTFAVAGSGYKSLEYGVVAFGSAQELVPTGGKKYAVGGFNIVGRKYFSRRSGMEVSLDFMSKQSIIDFQPEVQKTQLEIIQVGLFAGYLLPMDKFQLVIGMGAYLRDKFKPEEALYHRVGMRYVFRNRINLNLVLKSHWARADYVEYGIGYTFSR